MTPAPERSHGTDCMATARQGLVLRCPGLILLCQWYRSSVLRLTSDGFYKRKSHCNYIATQSAYKMPLALSLIGSYAVAGGFLHLAGCLDPKDPPE